MATTAVEWMAGIVTQWMDGIPWPELQEIIATEGPLTDRLLGQYPPWQRRIARGMLAPRLVAALEAAGTAEWSAVVDILCRTRPTVGQAVWVHEPWFHTQLDAARTQFLAS